MHNSKVLQAIFLKRADDLQKMAERHWAKAKNGEGNWHFKKAKAAYRDAEHNRILATSVK